MFEYARNLETLNDWVSISAFFLGGSILIFVINFVWSTVIARVREEGNPWQLARPGVAGPLAAAARQLRPRPRRAVRAV